MTKPSPLASMALKAFSIFVSFIFDGGGRVGVSNFVKIVGLLRGHTYVTSVLRWREGGCLKRDDSTDRLREWDNDKGKRVKIL